MNKIYLPFIFLIFILTSANAESLKELAESKITDLQTLISQAESASLDTEREALALWVASEFLRFADWDESTDGLADNEREFGKFSPYAGQKSELAAALPNKERQDVITLLETAISELTEVINGTVTRRAVPMVDWENITPENNQFTSNGKPIFLYDYFSKSMGAATNDPLVYNDYLGHIDHPNSISNHYVNEDMELVAWRQNEMIDHPSTTVGYTMLWHKGDPTWQESIDEVNDGVSLFMSYDIDNPTMRSVWEKSLQTTAANIKDKKFIDMGYCLANEPHWFSEEGHWTAKQGEMTSISSYTLDKFREWLKVAYDNDINALAISWQGFYFSFDDIDWTMPVPASYKGTAKWYDWCRFNMDRANEWFAFLQNSIHSSDPNASTHVKIMTDVFAEEDRHHGIDLEAVTELTTYIGDDAKARKRENSNTQAEAWEGLYAYYWEELCVSYDFMESVSPDKIHVNSESHFLSTSQWRDLDMQPAYVRNVYWLATVLGMDANLSWFWARDPDGSIEDRFDPDGSYTENSYAGSAAQQALVVNEYAKVMMDMNAFSEEILKLRSLEKPMRIFYSEASVIMKSTQMHESFGLYESLFFNGFPLGYATENIISNQDNDNWEAIIVYKTEYATDAEFQSLQSYLDNGGTVIIDNGRSLSKDEHGEVRSVTLTVGNGTIHNMGSTASLSMMQSKALEVLETGRKMPKVTLTESNGLTSNTCMWRVAQDTDGDYLVNILNLGKNTSTITLKMSGGGSLNTVTNMLTGEVVDKILTLESEGMLLLKVNGEAASLDDNQALGNVKLIPGQESLTILDAIGKDVTVYNISGQCVLVKHITNNETTLNLPQGVALVSVEGEGVLKALVK